MNTDEARRELIRKRNSLHDAINEMDIYRKHGAKWKASESAKIINSIKSLASDGGVDINTWNGDDPAPPVDPDTPAPPV